MYVCMYVCMHVLMHACSLHSLFSPCGFPAVCLPLRRRLHVDKEWRKQRMFGSFFRSFAPQTADCAVELDVQATCRLPPVPASTVHETPVSLSGDAPPSDPAPVASTAVSSSGRRGSVHGDRDAFVAEDSTADMKEGKLRCVDSWYLTSILGAGNARNLALSKPFDDVAMVPLLSIAALVSRNGGVPPDINGQVRLTFCLSVVGCCLLLVIRVSYF